MVDEGAIRLSEAILKQLSKDYVRAYRIYKRNQKAGANLQAETRRQSAKDVINECEKYIKAHPIMANNAEYIIENLRKISLS